MRYVICLFVLILLINARSSHAKEYEYAFPNGKVLIFETDEGNEGVYLKKGDKNQLLLKGLPRSIPDASSSENSVDDETKVSLVGCKSTLSNEVSYKEFTIAQIDHRAVVFTAQGKAIALPADYNRVEIDEDKQIGYQFDGFEHNGHDFFLVQLLHKALVASYEEPSTAPRTSEIFVIRDDGMFALIPHVSYSGHTILADDVVAIGDGILRITEAEREIDLEHFEEEALFQARLPQFTTDEYKNIVDPFQTTRNLFPDWAKDPLLKAKVFETPDLKKFDSIRKALAKKTIGSVVILGPAGVGKTELVKSFISKIAQGIFPEIPRTLSVLYVDPSTLGANSSNVGITETRIKAMVEVVKARPTVLFIDELHSLQGQGTHKYNSNDVFQMLKPVLAAGELKIIGTSTAEEYDAAFLADQPLYQRFTKDHRQEFDKEETIKALQGFFKRDAGKMPTREVFERIYALSSEYNATDAQPRKAVRLAEEARTQQIIDGKKDAPLSENEIKAAAATLYGVDAAQFDPKARKQKLLGLKEKLDEFTIGQDEAKELLKELAYQAYTGVSDSARPRIRVLFNGLEEPDKIELASAFGNAMDLPVKKIEISRHANSRGTLGFLRETANALRKNAFSVIVLDGIEHAPRALQNAIFHILDNGTFTVRERAAFVEVNARHASFILTTATDDDLKLFQNKVQGSATFHPLTREQFKAAVKLHLKRILEEQNVKQGKPIQLPIENKVLIEDIVAKYYRPDASSQEALNALQSRVLKWLAHDILEDGETHTECQKYLLGQ